MENTDREQVLRDLQTIGDERDRDRLADAAARVAASDDAAAIGALARHLQRKEFLARLDDLNNPQTSTFHLHQVWMALEAHPSPAVEALCLAVAESPEFTEDPYRLNDLLRALLAVRPVSPESAALVRRLNGEGFYHVAAPLLVQNRSPIALAVFEEMILDTEVDPPNRIDALHFSVLPHRTEFAVLAMCERLLDENLESEVELGILETLFHYKQKPWFGPACFAPWPPPWSSATEHALRLARELAGRSRTRPDLPPDLAGAIDNAIQEIDGILEQHRP